MKLMRRISSWHLGQVSRSDSETSDKVGVQPLSTAQLAHFGFAEVQTLVLFYLQIEENGA